MSNAQGAAVARTTTTDEANAIEVDAVAKTFPGRPPVAALEPMSFTIPEGRFVSVIGPSGCGKSTLLRMVAGLLEHDPGGSITVHGNLVRRPPPDLGVVFQTNNMLPWRTMESNIRLAGELRGLPGEELRSRVQEMVDLLGLTGSEDKYPHELSGGMRQRAAIGQTLVARPRIVLLDEPFGALDALTRDRLNVELLRIWQEQRRTMLLVTHSIPEAVFLSDSVLVMSDRPGRLVTQVGINIPRPRDASSRDLPEFSAAVHHLRELMEEFQE